MRTGLPPLDAFTHSVNLSLDWLQIFLIHLSHILKIQVALAVVPIRALMFTGHLEWSGANSIIRYCLLITRWSVCNCPSVFCCFVLWVLCSSLCKLCSRVSFTVQLTASSYFRYFGYTALLIQSSFVGPNTGPHRQKDALFHSASPSGVSIFIFSWLLLNLSWSFHPSDAALPLLLPP